MDKLFIPVYDNREIKKYVGKLKELIRPYKNVLITSTIQFKHKIKELSELLKGHNIIIHSPILGCVKSLPDADCIIIITTGNFHALRVGVITKKPVFIINPFGVKKLDKKLINNFLKKQAIRVSKVVNANIIGIIMSTKPGQKNEKLTFEILDILRKYEKQAFIFVANEISPLQLNDFPVDAWINTACPRIVEDEFNKPIVNWDECKNFFKLINT